MKIWVALGALACLAGCGDHANDGNITESSVVTPPSESKATAETSDIAWDTSEAGITPFIAFVHLSGTTLADVSAVTYTVAVKPGSASKPVRVTYTREALESRGRFETAQSLRLPVFGLYSGYDNPVSITLSFVDCSTQTLTGTVTAAAYADPNGVYDHPLFIKSRATGSELGFDFFMMKSGAGTPIIVDTDGAIRWVGLGTENSISSAFTDNGF